jgi:long-chain acyl-CoA synthetase
MITHSATASNLAALLEHQAILVPDRVAVTCRDVNLTYAQLNARASQIAAGLAALGIQPGDHVALSCPNVPWFPMAYYGILKAGAVVVQLNVLLKPREIAYHLQDSDAKALLVFEGTPELPMAQMARAGCDALRQAQGVPSLSRDEAGCRNLIVMTLDPAAPAPVSPSLTLGQLMHAQPSAFDTRARRPEDTAVMLYTSGTTGQPKGAELTHANMTMNAICSREMLISETRGAEQDVHLITLPLFHSTAQTCQMNAGLYGGSRLVLLPRFEPQAVLQTMQRERVGFWIGVPTMYWALLKQMETDGGSPAAIAEHLRVCVSGGAPMPVEVMTQFERTFGVRVLEGYGLSETSPVACFNQIQRPSKPGTVGLPIFGVDVRCVDDEGKPVATGERGEVVIRGHNVMKGYYKRPEATAEVMRDGWFHTGDIGTLDADGYVAIVDRKKDMILRGGFNVYPRELEEVMMTHPAVSLVAVVGVPDERLGEEVKAFVVKKPGAAATEEDLVAWCREQFAAYKYPRLIEFRDALPMGATGKILKRELRPER